MENAKQYLASILPVRFNSLIAIQNSYGEVLTSPYEIENYLNNLETYSKIILKNNIYWTKDKVFTIEGDRYNNFYCNSVLRM